MNFDRMDQAICSIRLEFIRHKLHCLALRKKLFDLGLENRRLKAELELRPPRRRPSTDASMVAEPDEPRETCLICRREYFVGEQWFSRCQVCGKQQCLICRERTERCPFCRTPPSTRHISTSSVPERTPIVRPRLTRSERVAHVEVHDTTMRPEDVGVHHEVFSE